MTSVRDPHRSRDLSVLANAWDAGSARLLVAPGAEALATSSAAHAFALGLPDGGPVPREAATARLGACRCHAAASVGRPGERLRRSPDDVAATVRRRLRPGWPGSASRTPRCPPTPGRTATSASSRSRSGPPPVRLGRSTPNRRRGGKQRTAPQAPPRVCRCDGPGEPGAAARRPRRAASGRLRCDVGRRRGRRPAALTNRRSAALTKPSSRCPDQQAQPQRRPSAVSSSVPWARPVRWPDPLDVETALTVRCSARPVRLAEAEHLRSHPPEDGRDDHCVRDSGLFNAGAYDRGAMAPPVTPKWPVGEG